MKYDAIVAGAGIAGLSFAARLANYGHRVLVLEPSPKETLGHDWWDTIESRSFDRMGLPRPTPPEARTPFTFKVNVEGVTYPVLTAMPPDMVNIERRLLAARMVAWAVDAGAEIRFGWSAVSPMLAGGSCIGVVAGGPAGATENIGAPIVVDASGASGAIRRTLPTEFHRTWGFDAEVPASCMMNTWRAVAVDTSNGGDSVICMGRGNSTSWISREPDGLVDVFAGSLGGGPSPEDPEQIALEMIARQGGLGDWVRPGVRCRIPLRRPFDGLVAPGFMLIGDSACMANPINGSGMTIAIDAAVIASDTAHAAIMAGRFDAAALWPYPAAFFRTNADLAFLDALKSFVFSAPRDPMLDFFRAGGLKGAAFWKMRDEFTPAALAAKSRAFMRTKGAPALLAPLAKTIGVAMLVEKQFERYPEKPSAFKEWRRLLKFVRA